MDEPDFLAEPEPAGEGLPGWETETITGEDPVPTESDLPTFQDQVVDPSLMEYRRLIAGMTEQQLKEMIEKNNPGMARKDIQRIVQNEKDKQLSEALERVGVKMGELPNDLLMPNPGDYRPNKKVQEEISKLAFGSPGLFMSGQRLPYHARGWNIAEVNKYQ